MGRIKRFLSIIFNIEFWGTISFVYGLFSGYRDEFMPVELAQKLRLGGIFIMIDWYWFVILGLVLWAGSVAWKASQIRNKEEPSNIKEIRAAGIIAENAGTASVNQSGGLTAGAISNSPIFQGGFHIHGQEKAQTQNEEVLFEDDFDNNDELYQSYQIQEGDTWETIAQQYGGKAIIERLRNINQLINPIQGASINVPVICVASKTDKVEGYTRLKVTNGNRERPAFCRAFITKMEQFKNNEWIPIDVEQDGPLSWHQGRSDNNGFREVYLSPGFINIARLPDFHAERNHYLFYKVIFTHLTNVERDTSIESGKFRLFVEVQYKFSRKVRTENWFGYIDASGLPSKRERKLSITDMDNLDEWK